MEDESIQQFHDDLFIFDTENLFTDDKEVKKEMLKAQDKLKHKIDWIQSVLEDPELKVWYATLSHKSKKYNATSFLVFLRMLDQMFEAD